MANLVASSRESARVSAPIDASLAGRVVQRVLAAVTVAYSAWVGSWLWNFWALLRESAPVLDMFRTEFGGVPMTLEDWKSSGAVDVFCAHAGADASTNAIGRHIDAGSVYWPSIFVYGSGVGMLGVVLMMFHGALGQRHNSWAVRTIPAMWLVAIVLLATYSADITALTDITE